MIAINTIALANEDLAVIGWVVLIMVDVIASC